ncbi:MAG TPA: hypothetical protein VJN50_00890 [Actinomycetota bacterium]|nr:hypothetical protein [Actinomycetota bacterium]
MLRRLISLALVLPVLLASCDRAVEVPTPTRSSTPAPSSRTASPTPEPVEPPGPPKDPYAQSGPATGECINGWRSPAKGSALHDRPLEVIRLATGVEGPLVVMHLRYFEGPESPPSDKGYLALVQRWYVRAYAKDDPAFQARFLVEGREFGDGLVAVAPYDTTGFRSPDWRAFQYDESNPDPRPVRGLPGEWAGGAYDFVEGGAGLTIPGLPEVLVGCLDGS